MSEAENEVTTHVPRTSATAVEMKRNKKDWWLNVRKASGRGISTSKYLIQING